MCADLTGINANGLRSLSHTAHACVVLEYGIIIKIWKIHIEGYVCVCVCVVPSLSHTHTHTQTQTHTHTRTNVLTHT